MLRSIERIGADGRRVAERDEIVEESPLIVTARGVEAFAVMRTPGHDLELVRGLLHAEGAPRAALRQVDVDVVDVDLDGAALARRALTATAACGVCGRAAIADLERRAREVDAEWQLDAAAIADLPSRLRDAQTTFAATGGLHAAGLFDRAGALVAVREDVGRHNAVDKLVGWGLEEGARFDQMVLVPRDASDTSSRRRR
jgi:FdhD protein